ncbi:hypothetical protein EST92_11760 [Streptomyces sp. TM32]|uniref:CHAP domain-containing protein n=1 Tax=Streptomyces sp. TM32 TaxID=1652669 RepID=UPI00101146A0|nr:CHAP domain-containing protein [Streptomyces sp. TM32]RXS84227.1 hypothetical protein EST92_11760 [Streptomyces sp. TM32]
MKWFQRQKPAPRRPDQLRIAELEYELLGIEPLPGTAADFAIKLKRAFRAGDSTSRPGDVAR